jgi:hypothetical protein
MMEEMGTGVSCTFLWKKNAGFFEHFEKQIKSFLCEFIFDLE